MYNLRKNKTALAKSRSVDTGVEEIALRDKTVSPEVLGKNPEERRLSGVIKAHAYLIRYTVVIIICLVLLIAGGLHLARSFTHDPTNPEAVSRLEASEARLRSLFSVLINLLIGHPNPAIGALASKPEVKWGEKTFSHTDNANEDEQNRQWLKNVERIMMAMTTINSSNTSEYTSIPENRDHTEGWTPSIDAYANSTSPVLLGRVSNNSCNPKTPIPSIGRHNDTSNGSRSTPTESISSGRRIWRKCRTLRNRTMGCDTF